MPATSAAVVTGICNKLFLRETPELMIEINEKIRSQLAAVAAPGAIGLSMREGSPEYRDAA
jgi:hypothetical protein